MIDRVDHVVLNCRDVEATEAWYERVVGFEREEFFGPIHRTALKFGRAKINLRPVGAENWITAAAATPGSLDLCFITETGIGGAIENLKIEGVEIIRGPTAQTGAMGPMTSVYFRDLDCNFLEIASYNET